MQALITAFIQELYYCVHKNPSLLSAECLILTRLPLGAVRAGFGDWLSAYKYQGKHYQENELPEEAELGLVAGL